MVAQLLNAVLALRCGCVHDGQFVHGINKREFLKKHCRKGSTLTYLKLFQHLPE